MADSELRMGIKPDFKGIYEFVIRNSGSSIRSFHMILVRPRSQSSKAGRVDHLGLLAIVHGQAGRAVDVRRGELSVLGQAVEDAR